MADFSIIKKISLFFETVVSTSFFLVYCAIGVILLFLMIYDIKKKKKISRIIYIVSLVFFTSFIIIRYFNIIINICDAFIETVVKALYFPNLALYITMLLISNITFFILFFSKRYAKSYKIVGGVCSGLIDILFIMIISLISINNIDISNDVRLYDNSTILTFLQLSMALFVSMYLIFIFIKLHQRFRLFDKVVTFDNEIYPDMGIYIKDHYIKGKFNESEIKFIKKIEFNNIGKRN